MMNKQLSDITDIDIFELAQFLDDEFKYMGEISEIRRGIDNYNVAWTILFWKNRKNEWATGRVYVSNKEVYYSNLDTEDRVHINFSQIQWLLDRGYKIFKTKGE